MLKQVVHRPLWFNVVIGFLWSIVITSTNNGNVNYRYTSCNVFYPSRVVWLLSIRLRCCCLFLAYRISGRSLFLLRPTLLPLLFINASKKCFPLKMVSLFPRGHKMSVQSGDSYSYRAEYTVHLQYPFIHYNKHSIRYNVENEFIYIIYITYIYIYMPTLE
jgi:hypothetical protein